MITAFLLQTFKDFKRKWENVNVNSNKDEGDGEMNIRASWLFYCNAYWGSGSHNKMVPGLIPDWDSLAPSCVGYVSSWVSIQVLWSPPTAQRHVRPITEIAPRCECVWFCLSVCLPCKLIENRAAVCTVTQQEGLGFDSSCFLPQFKDMHVRPTGEIAPRCQWVCDFVCMCVYLQLIGKLATVFRPVNTGIGFCIKHGSGSH